MTNQDLLSFQLSGDLFAVASDSLLEVLEPVAVSPLPLVPEFVDGLINVGGAIIPQIDLAKFIYPDRLPSSDSLHTLLVVEVNAVKFALKVNEIQETLSVSLAVDNGAADVDEPQSVEHGENQEVSGAELSLAEQVELNEADDENKIYKLKIANKLIHVFKLDVLADIVRSDKTKEHSEGEPSFLGDLEQKKQDEENFHEFLLVAVAGVEYAIALTDVYDVSDVSAIHELANSPDALVGVALVRQRPRLVLSLPELLGMDGAVAGLHCERDEVTVVMVERKKGLYGFAVDEVKGLDVIAEGQISFDADGNVLSILRSEDQTVIEAVSAREVIDNQLLAELKPFLPDVEDVDELRVKHVDLLRFTIAGTVYAIATNDIKRIIYNKKIEPLLETHQHIVGTIEFEGSVIPVVDLSKQLANAGNQAVESDTILETEFVVVSINKSDWAFLIDHSDQIIAVPETAVDHVKNSASAYVSAYTVIDEKLLAILNVAAICKANTTAQFRLVEEV